MSLGRDAEQKHGAMRGTFKRTIEREPLFPGMDKTIEKLKTRIQELETALNNRFCLNHQKRFLGPGKHSSYEGDPLTPSGAGCIYCNMIRLEAENKELRELLWLRHGCQGFWQVLEERTHTEEDKKLWDEECQKL